MARSKTRSRKSKSWNFTTALQLLGSIAAILVALVTLMATCNQIAIQWLEINRDSISTATSEAATSTANSYLPTHNATVIIRGVIAQTARVQQTDDAILASATQLHSMGGDLLTATPSQSVSTQVTMTVTNIYPSPAFTP